MADTKISDLAAVTDVIATDEYVLARSGASKKITAANLLGAWQSFTPTLTASSSNPTLGSGSTELGRWCQIGKLAVVHIRLKFGSSGTAAGSGNYRLGLPFTLSGSHVPQAGGMIVGYDSSAGDTFIFYPNTTASLAYVEMNIAQTTTAGNVTQAVPIPWAAGDEINATLTLEAA